MNEEKSATEAVTTHTAPTEVVDNKQVKSDTAGAIFGAAALTIALGSFIFALTLWPWA